MSQPIFLQEAHKLVSLGYRIFPCIPNGKQPLISNWQHDASSDEWQIETWWTEYPTANIGLLTTGLIALDRDVDKATGKMNPDFPGSPDRELELATGPCATTPRGGRHNLFRQRPGRPRRNTTATIAKSVDTRSDDGFIVVYPSVVDGKQYQWDPTNPLDVGFEKLPFAPEWLEDLLDERKPSVATNSNATAAEAIPEGQRNSSIASYVGSLRRFGSNEAECFAAAQQRNSERCRPPLPEAELRQIVKSICRHEPNQISEMLAEGFQVGRLEIPQLKIITAGELIQHNTTLRRSVLNGLLRLGEVMNIISAPKFGKSWLVLGLALSVATGFDWLGKFPTYRGNVLLIDNELHPETLAHRLPIVANTMGLNPMEYEDRISVVTLRGGLIDLRALAAQLVNMSPGKFDLIIMDAWYRFQPSGSDENSNGDVAALYNLLDSVAHKINCAFACVHHSSKGSQSGKSVTDVGSGAGAQARAPDTHLVMRPHEADNAVVVDAAVRSWAPIEPFCMRWNFPLWTVDDQLDPKDLRKNKPRSKAAVDKPSKEEARQSKEQAAREKVLQAYKDAPNGDTASRIAAAAGMNSRMFGPIQADLLRSGIVAPCRVKKNHSEYDGFKLVAAS